MKKGVKKCLLITVCILNFQMCMFSYATARESTPNVKVNRSKSRSLKKRNFRQPRNKGHSK